jgi:hypothetical protein
MNGAPATTQAWDGRRIVVKHENRALWLLLGGCMALLGLASSASAGSMNGAAGQMPAYYDAQLFTINFKELPPNSESSVLAHNKSINTIYMSDQAEAMGVTFASVIDAIQGDGFNPLWQEVQVVFVGAPHQLFSDTEILAAAVAGEVILVPTTEVYRCSVVGSK